MSERQFHIQCTAEDIGKYVFLPGDPGRTEWIASYLEHPVKTAQNREFTTWTGTLDGTKVSVTSTGIGGPSTAIAMEELAALGAHTFLRIGTCGGMQPELIPGTLIIPTGAIRMEGTSQEYVPLAFPAVPDFGLTQHLVCAAQELAYDYRTGVVQCKDAFYGQHDPDSMAVGYELKNKWDAWIKMGCLASEMETAALLIAGSYLRVRVGACFLVLANQERAKKGLSNVQAHDTKAAIETAVEAVRELIKADKAD